MRYPVIFSSADKERSGVDLDDLVVQDTSLQVHDSNPSVVVGDEVWVVWLELEHVLLPRRTCVAVPA